MLTPLSAPRSNRPTASPYPVSSNQNPETSTLLTPDLPERSRLLAAVDGLVQRYLAYLEGGDAFVAGPVAPASGVGPSEDGASLDDVIAYLEHEVLRKGGHPASPMHLAYITGGGLYHTALADYLSSAANKFAGLSATGPGPVEIERSVIRWTADLVGYPAGAGGHVASGGSLATFAAIVAAREAHGVRSADVPRTAVYMTSQTHGCVAKSLRIAGLGEAPIRLVPVDARFRMDAAALARMIEEDRAAGLRPWLVVATAGTTDVGAVDPLDAIGDVASDGGCWFHVDAAYGGFFLLTKHGRAIMRGIERSDSAVLDPHKSLFLPWGAGIVLARDAAQLAAAHSITGAYLPPNADEEYSPADLSPELTKPFRALRMWLPLALIGTSAFREALEEKLELARYFAVKLTEAGFAVDPPPDLSTVAFRWQPDAADGVPPDEVDRINRDIVETLRRDGELFISSTVLNGGYTIRGTVLNHRVKREHIDRAVSLVVGSSARLRLAGRWDR